MNFMKYFPVTLKQLLLILFAGVSFISCEREMVNEIVSVTPPELHVIVYQGTDKANRLEGATVSLYASDADRTANTNAISSTVTNNKGEAIFAEKDFRKGELFVKVAKAATVALAKTPYLLQNDGKTVFWVAL